MENRKGTILGKKFIVLLGDGMADEPIPELKGKTPLQAAHTPHLDYLAQRGTLGLVWTIPAGFPPGSDVANLSIFGYDPNIYFTGRAPLEAAAMGIKLEQADVAFRCNLITLRQEGAKEFMEDFSAGHISTAEARELILEIERVLGHYPFQFYPGVSYRHLLVWKNGEKSLHLQTTPPHDIINQEISNYLPRGEGEVEIQGLMQQARKVLAQQVVNQQRRQAGKREANAIWLWGQGRAPFLPPLTQRFCLTGSIISAVDLVKGIGFYAGLEIVNVPGATGYLDTNYAGKVTYALAELDHKDFVYVHVEAPDEASHNGNLQEKIKAIEDFDQKIVGPICTGLRDFSDYRLLVLPDHPTPLSLRTHAADPVPFIIFDAQHREKKPNLDLAFNELAARQGGIFIKKGHELMDKFLGD
ncbi:MAG: cofactor-independent phosphoglycerate mutase [Thermodesulfobacteriota bacterium]